jgi:hypothetical protein
VRVSGSSPSAPAPQLPQPQLCLPQPQLCLPQPQLCLYLSTRLALDLWAAAPLMVLPGPYPCCVAGWLAGAKRRLHLTHG